MTDQMKTDTQLLRAFVETNDQSAFAEILQRHAPMVGRVCYRIIGDAAEAEDAAQAVFLVLVKKAASLRPKSSLGSWLHGVARTTSLHAIRGRARRKTREETYAMTHTTAVHAEQPAFEAPRAAILASLDAALASLSERQRQAVVLRHLEGRPPDECAAMAGCSVTALNTRASDGIARLRRRFAKRGIALTAAACAAAIKAEAQAAVAPTLLPSIMAATRGLVAGAKSTAVSSTVSSLVEGGIRMLFWNKLQMVGVSVLVVASLIGAGGAIIAAQEPGLPRDGEQRPVESKKPEIAPANVDKERFRQASVVLRVRPWKASAGTKYVGNRGPHHTAFQKVVILNVYKNNGPEQLKTGGTIGLKYDDRDRGVSHECTVYVEPDPFTIGKKTMYYYRFIGKKVFPGSRNPNGNSTEGISHVVEDEKK